MQNNEAKHTSLPGGDLSQAIQNTRKAYQAPTFVSIDTANTAAGPGTTDDGNFALQSS